MAQLVVVLPLLRSAVLVQGQEVGAAQSPGRTNLCPAAQKITAGILRTREGLSGQHLIIGTAYWGDKWLKVDDETGEWSGYEYNLVQELSKRGNFTYDLVLHNRRNLDWDAALWEMARQYDLVTVGYWVITPARAMDGMLSPFGFVDTSPIFVAKSRRVKKSMVDSLFQFMQPFTPLVWAVLAAAAVITALVYCVVERGRVHGGWDGDEHIETKHRALIHSVFQAFLQVAGAGGLSPRTWPGKLLLLSWAWCVVLFISAYTANLASFLVSLHRNSVIFTSLEDALSSNAPICMRAGLPDEGWFNRTHPDYHNVVRQEGDRSPFLDMLDGKCDGVVINLLEFETIRDSRELNSQCDLKIIGHPLTQRAGGYMALSDYTDKCTNVVHDVLASIFIELAEDGTLDALYQEFLQSFSTRPSKDSCRNEQKAHDAEDEETPRLGVAEMAGIVGVHGAWVGLSLFLFLLSTRCRSQFGRLSFNEEAEEAPDVVESQAVSAEDGGPRQRNAQGLDVVSF